MNNLQYDAIESYIATRRRDLEKRLESETRTVNECHTGPYCGVYRESYGELTAVGADIQSDLDRLDAAERDLIEAGCDDEQVVVGESEFKQASAAMLIALIVLALCAGWIIDRDRSNDSAWKAAAAEDANTRTTEAQRTLR